MEPPSKLAYTVAEAVKASGLGRTTIFNLIQSGRLRARKSGRRTIITAEDLRALLDALPERGVNKERSR